LKTKAFELTVEDNGRGFAGGETEEDASPTPGRVCSGNGSENMKRRMEAVGGTCETHSTRGAGTKVSFFIPLSPSSLRL
jgi:signal transduction histidine kinase